MIQMLCRVCRDLMDEMNSARMEAGAFHQEFIARAGFEAARGACIKAITEARGRWLTVHDQLLLHHQNSHQFPK